MIFEKWQYISPDGLTLNLHDPPTRTVLEMEGWGMSPAEISTTAGPFQHGVSPVSVRLAPRTIRAVVRHNGNCRNKYWEIRSNLINRLRLNRSSVNLPEPGQLRHIYFCDGTKYVRDMDVMLTGGAVFNETRHWDAYSVQEELQFVAHNPVLYDPTAHTTTLASWTGALVLPFTFPFLLGTSYASTTINYVGTWESYPTISITGPARDPFIYNTTTEKKIGLAYDIVGGETVTFNLGYDQKTVSNNFGQSLNGYISANSDMSDFCIQPEPLVTSGTNVIRVYIGNYTSHTSASLTYYDRFVG